LVAKKISSRPLHILFLLRRKIKALITGLDGSFDSPIDADHMALQKIQGLAAKVFQVIRLG
jgi:hypothetical protein